MNLEELLALFMNSGGASPQMTNPSPQRRPQTPQMPQQSLEELLSGEQTIPQGSSTFAYGGEGSGLSMPESNQRIQMILQALQAGEAPGSADPLLGPQVSQDLTPVYSPGATPGQSPFRFAGYEDMGFDPRTGAFTNIGIPQAPEQKATTEDKTRQKETIELAKLSKILDEAKTPADVKSMILKRHFPSLQKEEKAGKLETFKQQKETQTEIATNAQREKFVLENQSNLFKKGTGEPLMLADPEIMLDTKSVLKNYVPLKPENAKDKRQLDGVASLVDGFKSSLMEIKPLLSSTKKGIPGRLGAGTEIAYLRAKGDPRVRKMDALGAQITQLARGFGGDSRVSDAEMARLDKAIITGWTTKEGADATLAVLNKFIDNRALALGFNEYKLPQKSKPKSDQSVIKNKDRNGRSIISRDNGLNWEYE